MENENLATEILHELKTQSKRYFIMLIVVIIMLFASNIAWLYAWNMNKKATTSYALDGQDNANVVYSDIGGVNIDGQSENK